MFSELVGHTWHLLLVRWAGRRGAVHRPNLLRAETCPFPPSLCYPPPSSLPGQRGGRSPCRTRNSLTLAALARFPLSQSQAELFQVSADQWWPPFRGAPTQLRGPTRSPLTIQAWDLGWDAQKVTDLHGSVRESRVTEWLHIRGSGLGAVSGEFECPSSIQGGPPGSVL